MTSSRTNLMWPAHFINVISTCHILAQATREPQTRLSLSLSPRPWHGLRQSLTLRLNPLVGDHLMPSYLPGSLLHPVGLSSAKGSHSSFWHFSDKWMFLLWDLGVTFICSLEGGICHQYEVSKSPKVYSTAAPHQHLTEAFSGSGAEDPNSCTLDTKLSAYEPLMDTPRTK